MPAPSAQGVLPWHTFPLLFSFRSRWPRTTCMRDISCSFPSSRRGVRSSTRFGPILPAVECSFFRKVITVGEVSCPFYFSETSLVWHDPRESFLRSFRPLSKRRAGFRKLISLGEHVLPSSPSSGNKKFRRLLGAEDPLSLMRVFLGIISRPAFLGGFYCQ